MQIIKNLIAYLSILLIFSVETPKLKAQTTPQKEKIQFQLLASDDKGGSDGAVSPDGKYFVISSKRTGNLELWLFDITLKTWTQLTNDPGDDFEPQWSPDGSQIVFTSTRAGNKDIWTVSVKDKSLKQLTNDPEDDEYPSWSPKGDSIVFSGGSWGEREIYMLSLVGDSKPRRITERAGYAGACAFAPSGDYLICHSYETGNGDVFKQTLDGQLTWLTGEKTGWYSGSKISWDYKPTVSPDGKWVAFSRSEDGPTNIWIMPASGGTPEPLTVTNANDRWVNWAVGNRLFFHRIVDEGIAIKVFDRKTGKTKTVIDETEKPGAASFDPTGQQIVYSVRNSSQGSLKIYNFQTGKSQAVPNIESETDFPRWSPDGKKIAFLIREANRWQIATVNINGTDLKIWTTNFDSLKGMKGVIDWSPDSTQIVFKSDTAAFASDINILDVTTGKIRNITSDAWFDESPSWAPDSKGIIFMSTRGGNWTWGLYNLSVVDGTVSLIAPPDYTEKNFPVLDKQGRALWSAYDADGIERIVEKSKQGKLQTIKAAGDWARWASSSNDGRYILYTTIKHKVEYWMSEGEVHGSPQAEADSCSLPPKDSAVTGVGSTQPGLNPQTVRRSPVNFPHR